MRRLQSIGLKPVQVCKLLWHLLDFQVYGVVFLKFIALFRNMTAIYVIWQLE